MARINIDDNLDCDNRFKRLVRKLNGNEDQAFGMLIRFWRVAQKCWGDGKALVPFQDFIDDGFQPILDSGLAERRESGIYAKGSEERFAWYLQALDASKKGVEARKRPRGQPPGQPRGTPSGPDPVDRADNPPSLSPVPVPVPIQTNLLNPPPARDTGPGPGDAYGQGGRDPGPARELEPLDFEIPELIASEIEARARQLEAPPALAVPPDPAPPRPAPPSPPRLASPITPVSPARRVIPGPWPNTSRDTSRDTSPARRSDAPPGYRGPFALPMDGQEAGAEARAMFRSIWGERYSPPVPEPVREENTA